MHGTQADSLATEAVVREFRVLMLVTLAAGTLAGLAWFGVQYVAVVPLIETAETYEAAAQGATAGGSHEHDEEGWRPANGWQRTSFTALATVLTGIGFAAILFAWVTLTGRPIDGRRGVLWGLAGFTCFSLAPALGLPPQPPGVAAADLSGRQLWWVASVICAAIGLSLIAGRSRSWLHRIGGVACMSLPHVVGAPVASGENVVPDHLIREFTIASLASTGVFWLALGMLGGFMYNRCDEGFSSRDAKRSAVRQCDMSL